MSFAGRLVRFMVELNKQADEVRQRISEADGDPIEVLHGHKCGSDCWHRQNPVQEANEVNAEELVKESNCVVTAVCPPCFLRCPALKKLRVDVRVERCESRCSVCGVRSTDPYFVAARDVP